MSDEPGYERQSLGGGGGSLGDANAVGAAGPYTTTVPPRPAGFAFVLWNGTTDPGAAAQNGDLGIGW